MTIAVVWQEDGHQWCAADTRIVAGSEDKQTTEIASKIFVIPVLASAMLPDSIIRAPHFHTKYGFVYAGATSPASMTAITAATLLQTLARPGDRSNPPTFENIAALVHRLAKRFMSERRQFGAEGLFSAALFGWCHYSNAFKIAHIDGREDAGIFRVELSYPPAPPTDGDPWLVLGGARSAFEATLVEYRSTEPFITKRVVRRTIERMVADGLDPTVGGATSVGVAHENGFDLFCGLEPVILGQSLGRRVFNGLDLDIDVGDVGEYLVSINGLA